MHAKKKNVKRETVRRAADSQVTPQLLARLATKIDMTGIDKESVTREALRSFTTQAPRDVTKAESHASALYAAAFFGALNKASSFSFC